ncbi:MAG: flagellar type III secretion system pore protein FliP [Oscillibacter sp.]|nr:flagellar type III secretion system pore protein FliP [Oscillibacter sp.]
MADGIININGDSVQTLEIIYLMALFTLLPSAVILMTSFTRYVISLSFLRNAMGTQQVPPNMVLVGLSLFLTLFTMGPVVREISATAYQPYVAGEIDQSAFFDRAQLPLKNFMVQNSEISTIRMFCDMDPAIEMPDSLETARVLPLRVIVPAFATSELRRAFEIGLYLYIPFLLIDIIVSTVLMSMGMIMLPPSMISTPFKLLLFVSLNGWELVFTSLVRGFQYTPLT